MGAVSVGEQISDHKYLRGESYGEHFMLALQHLYQGKGLPSFWVSHQWWERLCHPHESEAMGSLTWPCQCWQHKPFSTSVVQGFFCSLQTGMVECREVNLLWGTGQVGDCEVSLLGTEMLLPMEGRRFPVLEKLIFGWSIWESPGDMYKLKNMFKSLYYPFLM